MKRILSTLALFAAFSSSGFAGTNPVSWSINQTIQNPSIVGRTYTSTYTFTNNLPFTMVKALEIDKIASPSSEFTYDDQCSGVKLAHNGTCTVKITFIPTVAGAKSVQLVVAGYSNDRVPVTPQTSTATGGSTADTQVATNNPQSFPVNISIGSPYPYQFTFTNNGSAAVTVDSLVVTQTAGTPSYSTSNCGSPLGKGSVCTVTGSYTPTSSDPSTQAVTATMTYTGTSGQKTAQVTTDGSINSPTGVIASFTPPYYLPAEMLGGSSNQKIVQAHFLNNTGAAVTATAQSLTITTGAASGTLTLDTAGSATNNCLTAGGGSKSLPQGGACIIQGTFEGDVVGADTQIVITGSLTTSYSGTPVTKTTQTYLVPSLSTARTISFENKCDFPVWYSFHGGALGGSPNCPTAACPTGTSCDTTTHACFWDNPAPLTGTIELAATTGVATSVIPFNSGTDPAIQWSGVISASLRCDAGRADCMVSPCGNSDGAASCAVGQGFIGPTTQAEVTFNISEADAYDVEVINGFTIPIAMTPGSHTQADGYSCGIAAGYTAVPDTFGSCDWDTATPPSTQYYTIVTSGGSTNSADCTGNEIYGIAINLGPDTVTQSCGYFLGFWTADQVCGLHPTQGGAVESYFQCLTPIGGPYPSGSNFYDLMKCSVPKGDTTPPFNSCYLTYTAAQQSQIPQCCGCMDWWTISGIGANPNSQSCTKPTKTQPQTSAQWNNTIQSMVQWLKKACPSAYVYTFDDKTSSFTCTNNLPNTSNTTNYTITFCQGTTGKPTGKYDGRKNPPSLTKKKV